MLIVIKSLLQFIDLQTTKLYFVFFYPFTSRYPFFYKDSWTSLSEKLKLISLQSTSPTFQSFLFAVEAFVHKGQPFYQSG